MALLSPVWGRGGTDADAVGSLYDRLARAVGRGGERFLSLDSGLAGVTPCRGDSPEPNQSSSDSFRSHPLLMAPSLEDFERTSARIARPLDGVDVIIRTSGSTDGQGHLVGLSLAALVASARATHERLGGPGQWVTSLPVHAIAGFQVVLRSALGGHRPVVYAPGGGFDADLFADRVAALTPGVPRYLSLVPTQLHRIIEVAPHLLSGFDAILVGGAALAPDLAGRAARTGARVVRTYGSTETAGGCVYDGIPLSGIDVRLRERQVGRSAAARAAHRAGPRLIQISGPTLAQGYLDTEASPFVEDDDGRWLTTHDLGAWRDGRLEVLGRADDVIISGGVNVNPLDVEAALGVLGGEWVVVGVADAEWGQRLVAITTGPATLESAREVTAALGAAHRPRAVIRVDALPLRPTGKVDRRAAALLVPISASPEQPASLPDCP